MTKDIEKAISQCRICESFANKQQKEPLISHEVPTRPWEKIGCDLCTFEGTEYLVTVDYFSNFIEIDRLSSSKGRDVIPKLKGHFARYGTPEEMYSDNGPPFQSKEFESFTLKYNIDHTTSSSYYPKSNGIVENAVKTVKSLMTKAQSAKSDPYLALLDFRNTQTEGLNRSPAQLLLGRRTKTLLPISKELLMPENKSLYSKTRESIQRNKDKQAKYYNRGTRELEQLKQGDTVRIEPKEKGKEWTKARVEEPVNIRSYKVQTEEGTTYRRNRKSLRKTAESFDEKISDAFESIDPAEPAEHSKDTSESNDMNQTTVESQVPKGTVQRHSENQRPESTVPRVSSRGRTLKRPSYLKDYV